MQYIKYLQYSYFFLIKFFINDTFVTFDDFFSIKK